MDVNANQVIAWDAVPGAIGYDVQIINANHGAVVASASVVEPEILVKDLIANADPKDRTSFYLNVRSIDAFGPGAWSPNMPFAVLPLPFPTNIRVL